MVTKNFKSLPIIILSTAISFIFIVILSFSQNLEAKKKTFKLDKFIKGMFIGEDLHPKYGEYQELEIPKSLFAGDVRYTDMKRKAIQKVIYRFINRQSTLAYKPDLAIEGIIWLEILYNEMIKHPKSIKASSIRDVWQAREEIRTSMGFQNIESTQEIINRYLLLSNMLKGAEVEDQEIDPDLKERKELLKNLKSNIDKAKKNYLNSMNDDELEKFEAKSFQNTNQSTNIVNVKKESTSNVSNNTDLDANDIKGKLEQLKEFFDDGLITQVEYNTKKQELLDEM